MEEMIMIKPRRKKKGYVIGVLIFLIVMYFLNFEWDNLILSFILGFALLYGLYEQFIKKAKKQSFVFETHYDKLSSLLLILFGIGAILAAITNIGYDRMILNFDWINWSIIGAILLLSGISREKSFVLVKETTGLVDIEGFDFSIGPKTQEIVLHNNRMVISNDNGQSYAFDELVVSDKIGEKLSEWFRREAGMGHIEIKWEGKTEI